MKIILDPQGFNMQPYGGVSRYYTEIFSRLKNNKDFEIILPIHESKNIYLNQSKLLDNSKKINLSLEIMRFLNIIGISTRSLNKKITKRLSEKLFKKSKFDLFVPTYYDPYFLDFIEEKPFVLTVYDMIHELYPQYFIGDPWNVVVNKRKLLDRATKIIAVSNNTKKDILRIYPHIAESKIEVIYHGNSIQVNENVQVDLPDNYILFVGKREFYKNFYLLVEAIQELLNQDKTLKLICAGGGEFSEEEILFLNKLDLLNQVEQKPFEENQLGMFYKKARCFVFPSEYEGFGIPVLESMACECPVVLTRNSSFPEVAGEAGIYFELNSKNDLKEKINLVLKDNQFREKFILKGKDRVGLFNWDDAVMQCAELYQRTII